MIKMIKTIQTRLKEELKIIYMHILLYDNRFIFLILIFYDLHRLKRSMRFYQGESYTNDCNRLLKYQI